MRLQVQGENTGAQSGRARGLYIFDVDELTRGRLARDRGHAEIISPIPFHSLSAATPLRT
jgi:hypothetical protein